MSYAQFELVGGLAGKTINLGGHGFVDGVFVFGPNDDNVVPSNEEVSLKALYLGKSYQAFLVGSPELEAAKARLQDNEAPPGELDLPVREEQEQQAAGESQTASTQRLGSVRTALGSLDPRNDAHWTGGGLPSVEAVRDLSGNKDVSRADITNLAPNLNRAEAIRLAGDDAPEADEGAATDAVDPAIEPAADPAVDPLDA